MGIPSAARRGARDVIVAIAVGLISGIYIFNDPLKKLAEERKGNGVSKPAGTGSSERA